MKGAFEMNGIMLAAYVILAIFVGILAADLYYWFK